MASPTEHQAGTASADDLIAEQFYAWEPRGRGWLVWDEPVEPEPPFVPFHWRSIYPEPIDDGRKHTLVSGLIKWVTDQVTKGVESKTVADEEPVEPLPDRIDEPTRFVELQVHLPQDVGVKMDVAEQFLLSLSLCHHALSFEVVGLPDATLVQIVCADDDRAQVRNQLNAFFPDAVIMVGDGVVNDEWQALNGSETVVAEFGLAKEFMLPIAGPKDMAVDPLVGITGALTGVDRGEIAMLQILFRPIRRPWAESILRSVTFTDGSDLFTGPVSFLTLAKEKVSRPLYGVVLRIACRSNTEHRAWELARRLTGALSPYSRSPGNELIPLNNDEYDPSDHASDVPERRCRRSGMILSSNELVGLVHWPSVEVRSAKLQRDLKDTKAVPSLALGGSLILGDNDYAGQHQTVSLKPDQRVRHMHVIGSSGTGKSTFLLNMILQDIRHGEGVAVIDPHGDLIDAVLSRIPEGRIQDVVLLDPADEAFPVGFNILAAHSEAEKNLLASDLVGIFRRLSLSNWGDQMNSVLANAVLAILESDRHGTLLDLRRFLVEKPFREDYLKSVTDDQIVYYWKKEFPLLTGRPQGPVLTRLDAFLRPKPIRYMVGQRENKIDFAHIMDSGKIFLARLSHGAFGEENAHLLGALLVSKFNQIAMSRQSTAAAKRRDFWLYVDEFHHFATPSMASLLSSVRKYRLGLVLAHQELHQLENRHSDVASAVMSNAYTRVCFRVGDQDAKKLEGGFSTFDAQTLQNLGVGEAICRIERAEFDFNLRTPAVQDVDEVAASKSRDRVVEHCRSTYAIPKETVEKQLRQAVDAEETETSDVSIAPKSKRGTKSTPVPEPTPEPEIIIDAPLESVAKPPDPIPIPIIAAPAVVTPSDQQSSRRTFNPPPKIPAEEVEQGRGGPQHRYLQQLIKQWADGMGYRATIERTILDGQGSIDVALEKSVSERPKPATWERLKTSHLQGVNSVVGYPVLELEPFDDESTERGEHAIHFDAVFPRLFVPPDRPRPWIGPGDGA